MFELKQRKKWGKFQMFEGLAHESYMSPFLHDHKFVLQLFIS